jgi:hypothetical protein
LFDARQAALKMAEALVSLDRRNDPWCRRRGRRYAGACAGRRLRGDGDGQELASGLVENRKRAHRPTIARSHKKRLKTESIESITTINHERPLKRDDFRHVALAYSWRMIFSENRYPLFGIMREKKNSDRAEARPEPAGRLRGFGGTARRNLNPVRGSRFRSASGFFR